MAFKIFVSHSTADAALTRELAEHLTQHGIDCYVAERDWKFGETLAAKIENALRDCDYVLALLTRDGNASAYVHQELGIATNMKKPILPVVEQGVDLTGFQVGLEYLALDRGDPPGLMQKLSARLTQLKASKEQREAVFWAIVMVAGAIFLGRQ